MSGTWNNWMGDWRNDYACGEFTDDSGAASELLEMADLCDQLARAATLLRDWETAKQNRRNAIRWRQKARDFDQREG